MAYIAREIRDRIARGDNCFRLTQLSDGRVMLDPAPDNVSEDGTNVNKELLQPIEDRVVLLMNRIFDNITSNPFEITFDTLDGVVVNGVWNTSLNRIEC